MIHISLQTIDLALKVCVGREVTVTTDIRIRERVSTINTLYYCLVIITIC